MFYNAFGICEYFEDINNSAEQSKNNSVKIINPTQTGFIETNTVTPQNIMQFQKKLNIEIFNTALINSKNINKFNYNTIGIQMDTIFDFELALVGSTKPFITNIVTSNNNNKIYFKYKDQYNYDINLVSDELIKNGLYNIIYLPIQPLMNISNIDVTTIEPYNNMNGNIITVDNNVELILPYNKIFEIYIFPIKQIKLICNYNYKGEKKNNFILDPNIYYYIYYNTTNSDPISITTLNIVNLNFITVPTNINLKDNSNLIYYNNFLNYNNKKFYNTINKKYDTQIMNCDDCTNNINQYGSRYSLLSYNGINNSYIKLPELNLSKSIITFSINFKTNNNNKQVLFDIGNISNDNKYINSLFVNFENNTVRFNYVKNNELLSTFLYNDKNPIINDNKWHNIIWTLTFDNWIIYVDNIKILNANKKNPNSSNFNCTSNFIGKKNNIGILNSEYSNFIGLIDNFKVYSKELSSFEIKNENIK